MFVHEISVDPGSFNELAQAVEPLSTVPGFEQLVQVALDSGFESPDKPGDWSEIEAAVAIPENPGDPVAMLAYGSTSNGVVSRGLTAYTAELATSPGYERIKAEFAHPAATMHPLNLTEHNQGISGNTIVFFPEMITGREQGKAQRWAHFFFDRYPTVLQAAIKYSQNVLSGDQSALAAVDDASIIEAKMVWGHLHDRAHHTGARPIGDAEHLAEKTTLHGGAIEELRVCTDSLLQVLKSNGKQMGEVITEPLDDSVAYPYVAEMIWADRFFRYLGQPNRDQNSDSLASLLALRFLHNAGALQVKDGKIAASAQVIHEALEELSAVLNSVEATPGDYGHASASILRSYDIEPGHTEWSVGGLSLPTAR
jgi:hypothetical protein